MYVTLCEINYLLSLKAIKGHSSSDKRDNSFVGLPVATVSISVREASYPEHFLPVFLL